RGEVRNSLEASAGSDRIELYMSALAGSTTIEEFINHLEHAYRSLNTIVVADTGSGMSLEDLSAHFLTIGTSSRKKAVDAAIASKQAKPPFLGEKGIGRLSAMRLGETLVILTARSDDKMLNRLDVDWRDFSNVDAMIEDIDIRPYVSGDGKPSPHWSGTTLR